MSERGKLSMDFRQHLAARFGRFFNGSEGASPDYAFAKAYFGFPPLGLLNEPHTGYPGFVIPLHPFVAVIFRLCSYAKIFNSIIVSDAIAVVNFVRAPFPVNVEPRQNMRLITAWIGYLYHSVAPIWRTCDFSGPFGVPFQWVIGPVSPPKNTCLGVVVENGSNKIGRQSRMKYLFSHAIPATLQRMVSIRQPRFVATIKIGGCHRDR